MLCAFHYFFKTQESHSKPSRHDTCPCCRCHFAFVVALLFYGLIGHKQKRGVRTTNEKRKTKNLLYLIIIKVFTLMTCYYARSVGEFSPLSMSYRTKYIYLWQRLIGYDMSCVTTISLFFYEGGHRVSSKIEARGRCDMYAFSIKRSVCVAGVYNNVQVYIRSSNKK